MIIDDDETINKELSILLKSHHYDPIVVNDFKNILSEIKTYAPDLILLDINIPFLNGETLLQDIRKTWDVPVIMVTSINSEMDEALSISYGADDYITKPYNPMILLLRIGSVLKRCHESSFKERGELTYKDLIFDRRKGTICKDTIEIVLTKNEMLIFAYLLNHQNQIVTRDELMTILWDNSEYVNENALSVNVSRLRTKLKEAGYDKAIETRKGMGYILL